MVWPALRMAVCPSKICSIGRNMRHRWRKGSRCRTSESVVVQVVLQRALRDGWDMLGCFSRILQMLSINQTSENSDPQGPEKMGKGLKKAETLVIFFLKWLHSDTWLHSLGLQLQGLSRVSPTWSAVLRISQQLWLLSFVPSACCGDLTDSTTSSLLCQSFRTGFIGPVDMPVLSGRSSKDSYS